MSLGGPQWDLRRCPPYPADGSGDLRDVEDVSISFISPTGDLPTGDAGPTHRPVALRSTPVGRTVGRLRAAGLVVALLAASLASVDPAVADTVVLVRAGDSLSRIADEHGVTLADLMAANGLTNPDLVFMGQALVIPGVSAVSSAPSSIVVVEWGDSLSVIAEDYGVTVAELLALNGLTDPDSLFVGQELLVPGGIGQVAKLGPTVVTVKSGESLSLIAFRYSVTVADLMAQNGITDPDLVYVGQRLTIPGFVPPTTTVSLLVVVVQSGDTLSKIASRFGVSVSAIMAANGLTNPDLISVGQALRIPGVTAAPEGPVASTDP